MLDARVPAGGWKEEELKREEQAETQVQDLMEETRLWRIANSAQWVAWGIVQAKIPGLKSAAAAASTDDRPVLSNGVAADESDDQEDEFDYLGYAQERALFLWGDLVLMGLVDKSELPEELCRRIKLVEY